MDGSLEGAARVFAGEFSRSTESVTVPSGDNIPRVLTPTGAACGRILVAGTAIASLNIFPFAGGAILQMISGFMIADSSLAEYRSVWLLMMMGMVVATIAALMSKERS